MAATAEMIPAGEVIACHTVEDWNNKLKAAKESNKLTSQQCGAHLAVSLHPSLSSSLRSTLMLSSSRSTSMNWL
uniref:Uncharacterized protein n=1 Tax=Brassica oleracea var. oleracea TaxID=109376 RepID=A0A0D3DPG6_BRAOL